MIVWDRTGKHAGASGDEKVISLATPTQSIYMLFVLPRLYREIRKMLSISEPPDIVLLTHFFLLPLAFLLPTKSGAKIFDAAEFFHLDIPEYFGRFKYVAKPFFQFMEKLLLTRVKTVFVADSRDSWFENYYRDMGKRVQMLMNVPSKKDDSKPDLDVLEDEEKLVVAYVGNFKKTKGIFTALKAAHLLKSELNSVVFEFIGDWQKGRSEIEAYVKQLQLEDHVVFKGPFSYTDMIDELKGAKVGLALLQGESNEYSGKGGSRKIFAYMQAGIPIVGSKCGVVCSLVEETGCGTLVNVDSKEEVTSAIRKYLLDKTAREIAGNKGKEAFLQQYNWEKESGLFIEFLSHPVV